MTEDITREIASEFAGVFAFARGRWVRFADELHPELAAVNVTVLQMIKRRERATATELGAALNMDKAMLSRQVAKLRDLEFIATEVHEKDKRITWLSVTPAGEAILDSLHEKMASAYAEKLCGWSGQELSALCEQLKHFNGSKE